MEKKNSQMYNIDIKNTKEIYDFCLLNKIMDIDGFINKCFKKGFNIEKYGLIGEVDTNEVKEIIVEKIVEIIKEVPTPATEIKVIEYVDKEIVKEVKVIEYVDREVIKEIKVEVPVEKIVYIYDKKEENSVTNIGKICDNPEPIIVEKIVEVEKIIEVEKIVEVIKEVGASNDKLVMLQDTLNKLRKELTDKNTKIQELEGTIKQLEQLNINQGAVYMKGSNLTKNI
jgi:hypothetical protein